MKRIIIDMKNRLEQHMLSGHSFAIDRRLERRNGNIYLERSYVSHPTIAGAHTVLIPALNLWVMFWEGHGGPNPCRCYMHMARILDQGDRVVIEDLYLDVIVRQDGHWQLLDIDEFRAAVSAGELSPEQIQAALEGLEHACRLVDRSGGDIERCVYDMLSRESTG
jgi:predicted RNA-binding protein associated with RNAse of E/G family